MYIPAAGVLLPQLSAAVFAVLCGYAACARIARDIHLERAIVGVGEEMVLVLKAGASHQLVRRYGSRRARLANGKLQAKLAEIEVTSRGTRRVQSFGTGV